MQTTAPRPLDRLWLRLKPKAVSLVKRLSRKPAASAATPKGTLKTRMGQGSGFDVNPERYTKPKAGSEDMQRLHKHFNEGRRV